MNALFEDSKYRKIFQVYESNINFDALEYLKIILIRIVDEEIIVYIRVSYCYAFIFVFNLVFSLIESKEHFKNTNDVEL